MKPCDQSPSAATRSDGFRFSHQSCACFNAASGKGGGLETCSRVICPRAPNVSNDASMASINLRLLGFESMENQATMRTCRKISSALAPDAASALDWLPKSGDNTLLSWSAILRSRFTPLLGWNRNRTKRAGCASAASHEGGRQRDASLAIPSGVKSAPTSGAPGRRHRRCSARQISSPSGISRGAGSVLGNDSCSSRSSSEDVIPILRVTSMRTIARPSCVRPLDYRAVVQ